YDVARQDWAPDLAAGIVDPARLPRPMWSTGIAGRVTAEAARATGLAEGTPVTAGTVDAAAEAVSVGVASPGDMMLMYGSTIFMILLTKGPLPDPRLWYAPWLYPGQHAAMAGLATSGTLTHWFRDRLASDLPRDAAFGLLAAEAEASPPGANGLLVLPYFSGERTPIHDPEAKGVVFGLNLTHRRGDLYRALLEGIAHGTRHVTDTFAALGAAPARLLAVGGGVLNPLWLQSTSDVTGLDQIVCTRTLGAAYGDAFLAAEAAGLAPRIADWNPPARRVTARPLPVHERHHALFLALYQQTRDIARDLSAPAQ
ncbi:MAG: carbohydrate kinase, partial [Mangrovicoccus sp.]|nr:carbohydrate kinase [Mangrovicoccus sp.]